MHKLLLYVLAIFPNHLCNIRRFISCLTDKSRSNAPLDSLTSVSSHATCRGDLTVATEARQTIVVIITFRKSNKKSLALRASAYRSSRNRNTLYMINRAY